MHAEHFVLLTPLPYIHPHTTQYVPNAACKYTKLPFHFVCKVPRVVILLDLWSLIMR